MKNYYYNTISCIEKYNEIMDSANSGSFPADNDEEFLQNFFIYFAHALIKDAGRTRFNREELSRMADIINFVGDFMDDKKFINTSDEQTAETLRHLGFTELPKSGKFWVFVNKPGKMQFSGGDWKMNFTDKLMF